MTARFSYFSHIEDLETGQLVLTSPFRDGADQPSICQYELHYQSSSVLEPDQGFGGVAAYHRLLPMQKQADQLSVLEEQPVFVDIGDAPQADRFAIASLQTATVNPAMPWLISSQMAREASIEHLLYPALSPADLNFHHWPGASHHKLAVPETWRSVCPTTTGVHFFQGPLSHLAIPDASISLAPWHHPFRLEGMKLAGLDLFQRYPDSPTIVLFDPTGEWLFALWLAFKTIRRLLPGSLPFRVVLVQHQPFHHLCRLFEGEAYDAGSLSGATHPACLPLAAPVQPLFKQAIVEMAGTCIAIPAASDQNRACTWFSDPLERLTRTLFVEEEDRVILINPFEEVPPSPPSEGVLP